MTNHKKTIQDVKKAPNYLSLHLVEINMDTVTKKNTTKSVFLTSVFLTLLFFSVFSHFIPVAAQESAPIVPETENNSNTEEEQETDSAEIAPIKTLDPETMTPEEGTVLGDGEEVILHENFVQIHGDALIKYDNVILRADHVWADFSDNLMRASGNVYLKVGEEETYSDELVFNLETKKGIARNGYTFSDPWYFGGSEIFKIEDNKTYIKGGTLTTCSLKHPHYHFSVSEVIIRMNEEMIAKNIVLRIGGIPLFYFPAIRRDLRKGKIAKIIVRVGTDSYQGPNIGIVLPLARKPRYDAALIYDRSARRGQGYGFEGKYRFRDTQFQEIHIPIPPDASPAQRTKLEDKAKEIYDRLEGDYDRYWLKQIFLEYTITEEDASRAKEEAEKIIEQLNNEDGDFQTIAQRESDHNDTRYDGGDMGFLARGETDKEGEPLLDPILEEAAFSLKEGEVSKLLRTDSAFHILKVARILDVYGEREIKLYRIDIAIEASDETQQKIREIGKTIHERAIAGESFELLATEFPEAVLSELNDGEGMPLNEMNQAWQYSVRRMEIRGDITEDRPVISDEGNYIFQLIKKEDTPTFEELAEEFEANWETFQAEVLATTEEEDTENQDGIDSENKQDTPGELIETETSEDTDLTIEIPPGTVVVDDENTTIPQELQNDLNPGMEDSVKKEVLEVGEDSAEDGEGEVEEEIEVYRKHGYRGRWEDPRQVASEAQSLYAGEYSRVLKTKKSFRLIKVDKKRSYIGDIYFYGADEYSFSRQDATRIGRRWNMRWGHRQSFYTPWDSRKDGRRPISFIGRTDWRALSYKENFQLPNESTLKSFGILTYGSALSTASDRDIDKNGNLTYSNETIGDITGRVEVRHVQDFSGEGTTALQKLPQLTLNFSRMRFNRLPVFEEINDRLVFVAEKINTEKPILSLLAFPTLEDTSFDMDIQFGNFYRQMYRGKFGEENNVFLQTLDLGFDLRKQSTILITPLRELKFNSTLNTNMIWHDKDQEKNRNIIRGVYSIRSQATNTLFRIYKTNYIPGVRKLRHELQSTLTFDYQPAIDEENTLYPFGPSTFFYERKRLTYNFNTNIEIKTRRSQSAHRIFYFDSRFTADFTEFESLYRRKYEPIESDFTIVPLPSRNLNMTVRLTHDPNPHPDDGKQFKMVGIRTNIRYTRQKWYVSFGNSFSKRHTSINAARSMTANGRYRVNRNLEFDFNLIYYPIEGQFYSQRISMNRNLHDWNLRISWSRVGIKREPPYDTVRQDFTFQVNLIGEPAVSMGVGYDATTETWGLHTLPAGVPYNAFGAGNSLGRSFF
ncbi:peptidylprolyl isomerase [Candidatus Poribacteria bacterium]|nr:peptidylprolyl isomerase [Candidatus Poribacteria bacterium]